MEGEAMTDGVARDLEQAEARLAAARLQLEYAKAWLRNEPETWDLFTEEQAYERVIANYRDAAIEVGRLRALAWTDDDLDRVHRALVAAGDELQEQGFKVWPLDATVLDRFARAALAAREEVQG